MSMTLRVSAHWHEVKRQECQVRRGGEASNSGDLSLQYLEPGTQSVLTRDMLRHVQKAEHHHIIHFYSDNTTLNLYILYQVLCVCTLLPHIQCMYVSPNPTWTWHILGPNMGTDPLLQPCCPLFDTCILQLSECTYLLLYTYTLWEQTQDL